MQTFRIERVKNGLKVLVSWDYGQTEEIVHADPQRSELANEVECFADFLRYLNDEYGPSTSRYSEARIYICVHPGDKHEKYTGEIF